jgi:predicted ATPase/DNA-binding SARP family transcriptional activator
MGQLAISLFGPLTVTLDGQPLTGFKYDKVRALLAYLAVEHERPHEREALLGLLWPDLPEDAARNNLRQSLLTLRAAISDRDAQPPFLLISRPTLQLNQASDHWLDVTHFIELLAACARHVHPNPASCKACAKRRQAAVALYQGEFLAEFFLPDSDRFEEWALLKREWLHRQMVEALAHLVVYHERRGQYDEALTYATRQVALDPWREETHRQLMRLYLLNGERSAALAQYESCRRLLEQELAVEPEEETTALFEQIRNASGLTPLPAAQLVLPAVRKHNLPPAPTPFVGREPELHAISRLLNESDCRLLTLFGPGGVGKTRLALQVAAEQVDAFADGVFYAPLVGLATSDLLPTTLLQVLQIELPPGSDPAVTLLAAVQDKELLLVLDNFEHLLAGADLLVALLEAAPQVIVLVTARERLNVQQEWLFPVEGLPQPATTDLVQLAENDAVQLFVQSARRLSPDFTLTAANGASIGRICQLVVGLPLAIELAASWASLLTCEEIAGEIERGIGFLTTTLRDVPARHRSLTAVFASSWQWLNEDEQRVVRQCTIFCGGFRREAAEQVAGATLSTLRTLVDKALLRFDRAGRYALHELIRQYGAEKLAGSGEQPEVQRQHALHYLHFAEAAAPELHGAQQMAWLVQLESEVDNLRTALQWAIDHGEAVIAGRFCRALDYFWDRNGRLLEGQRWLEQTLPLLTATEAEQAVLRADVLNSLGNIACELSEYERATALHQEGLTIQRALGAAAGIARALNNLGHIAYLQGNADQALAHFGEALARYRQLGDLWAITRLLSNMGAVLAEQGNFAEGERYQRESLALRRQRSDVSGIAISLVNLAEALHGQGKDAEALNYLQEGLQLFRQLQQTLYTAMTLCLLGTVTVLLGDAATAQGYLRESLQIFYQLGAQRELSTALAALGGVAGLQGEARRGARLLGAAEKLRETIGVPLLGVEQADQQHFVRLVQNKLEATALSAAWAEGRILSLAEVIAFALGH